MASSRPVGLLDAVRRDCAAIAASASWVRIEADAPVAHGGLAGLDALSGLQVRLTRHDCIRMCSRLSGKSVDDVEHSVRNAAHRITDAKRAETRAKRIAVTT